MNTPKGRRSAVAFTLIELLIVVCIIALSSASCCRRLQRARQSGQAGVCMHNIQQIGIAVHLYADANDDALVALDPDADGFCPLDRTVTALHPTAGRLPLPNRPQPEVGARSV